MRPSRIGSGGKLYGTCERDHAHAGVAEQLPERLPGAQVARDRRARVLDFERGGRDLGQHRQRAVRVEASGR